MIYKGKHGGYFLYELIDTDLLWEDCPRAGYKIGNVLLFGDKNDVALGLELVRADDLATALTYISEGIANASLVDTQIQDLIASLQQQLSESKQSVNRRDELLRDLSSDLESQRYSNKMLIAQLEGLREQISIEQLSRNEILGDLEFVSAETYRKELELQEAISAKSLLEQELAERICELLEMDAANADLQKLLNQHHLDNPAAAPELVLEALLPPRAPEQAEIPAGKLYTMPSGKQIQIYHEFPSTRKSLRRRPAAGIWGLFRVVGVVVLAALLLLVGSVLATALLNGISFGEALDTILKAFLP